MNAETFDQWRAMLQAEAHDLERTATGDTTIELDWLESDDEMTEQMKRSMTWTSIRDRQIGLRREFAEQWSAEQGEDEAFLRLRGLATHEVGRILFSQERSTIRAASGDVLISPFDELDPILQADLMFAYARLEDQRIHHLTRQRFPDSAEALQAAIRRLFEGPQAGFLKEQFKLVAGLDQLPAETFQPAADAYLAEYGTEMYMALRRLALDYLKLESPDDLSEMVRLAAELLMIEQREIEVQEPEDELHPALQQLIEVDGDDANGLNPETVAAVCGHDPDLVEQFVSVCRENVLAWTEWARSQDGELGEVSAGEAASWEATEHHLQAALDYLRASDGGA